MSIVATEHRWHPVVPGVWKMTVGAPEGETPLAMLGAEPALESLRRMGEAALPGVADGIGSRVDSRRTLVTVPLTASERVYGLGLQFMRMNHRGFTRTLRVNSDPKQDTGETHAPVPMFVSSEGYGLIVNTSRIVTMYCGSTVRLDSKLKPDIRDRASDPQWQATPMSDAMEIVVPQEPGVELLLIAGPEMLDVVRRYNLLCGGGALPPRWGLGFWHRVSIFATAEEVLAEAREFRRRDIPCDVIGLEPGWHSNSYPTSYEWSAARFPDPQAFATAMRTDGFRLNLWENPYVAPMSGIYESLKPLSGSHTVWGGLAPDFSLEEAQRIYMDKHAAEHLDIGVSGYKIDECDGSELTPHSWMFPAHASFPSGLDGERMRQLYGVLLQRMTERTFRSRGVRTYGLVRASLLGASSYPYVLYSDLYDHRQFVRALCNAGFTGLLWTPELRETDSAEDFVRRLQTVVFSPLAMLNAWASGVKPWNDESVATIVRKFIGLRMRLMPYLYSAFARYRFDGTPPFRAMQLETAGGDRGLVAAGRESEKEQTGDALSDFDSQEAAYGVGASDELDDQYMMGDSLLVAPLFAGQTSRRVALPPGDWYGFESGERYVGGRTIEVTAALDELPVFVRDGGIVPLMPALPHAPAPGESVQLEIRRYGTAPGRFLLYDDDGETYAYENGQYQWRELTAEGAGAGRTCAVSPAEPGKLSTYASLDWRFLGDGE